MKKNSLIRASALLVLLWYCMGIIGFDVHTCRADGRMFVATVFNGMSCKDIHPDHSCSTPICGGHGDGARCSCMTHSEESSCELLSKDCCSDYYQVLDLTGARISDDDGNRCLDGCHCGHCPCIFGSRADIFFNSLKSSGLMALHKPMPGFSANEMRASYGIWRI